MLVTIERRDIEAHLFASANASHALVIIFNTILRFMIGGFGNFLVGKYFY
jgi:heme/copper-type cytochrome/quinol oxidase subunit 1